MLPAELNSEQFNLYPPEAKTLAVEYLGTFRRLPLSFLPNLLKEVIDYDFKFPAERKTLERELANLHSLTDPQNKEWFEEFSTIQISRQLERFDWVGSPAQFVEQLSAYLWTTHQMDAFRHAAIGYSDRLHRSVPAEAPAQRRMGIAVIGQGVDAASPEPLFRKLRPHGAHFSSVVPDDGVQHLLDAVAARAKANPAPYGHWYIDGGQELPCDPEITCVSYRALEPVRAALLARIQAETRKAGVGPEALRSSMAQLRPADLGLSNSNDALLDRFKVRLFTEGSGTQVFSTSFTQWAAREALRRAQPSTLMVRFAPRQRQKPMSELLSPGHGPAELDPLGSLVDGDMGAYYNWINQQRLPGADQSMFLVWFENHSEAVAISSTIPRGTVSGSPATIPQILSWIS